MKVISKETLSLPLKCTCCGSVIGKYEYPAGSIFRSFSELDDDYGIEIISIKVPCDDGHIRVTNEHILYTDEYDISSLFEVYEGEEA